MRVRPIEGRTKLLEPIVLWVATNDDPSDWARSRAADIFGDNFPSGAEVHVERLAALIDSVTHRQMDLEESVRALLDECGELRNTLSYQDSPAMERARCLLQNG